MKKIIIPVFVTLLISPIFVLAQSGLSEVSASFKNFIEVTPFTVQVPTVIEIDINENEVLGRSFAVYDLGEEKFVNYYSLQEQQQKRPSSINDQTNSQWVPQIHDGNNQTYKDFDLGPEGTSRVSFEIKYDSNIRTNSLNLFLDQYVALPNLVTISYQGPSGATKTALSKYKPTRQNINFPEFNSRNIFVELEYSQPLRINELYFNDLDSTLSENIQLRFLAKPGSDYLVYLNQDRHVPITLGESPNLRLDEDVKNVGLQIVKENPEFIESDVDGDGVIDKVDNCVRISNPDQIDVDGNGAGDVCDDFDRDGIINSNDNCVDETNKNQADIDNDGIGDVCDDEESRITEKYPIIVWGGIIFAVLIFILLYLTAMKDIKKKKEEEMSGVDEAPSNNEEVK